MRPSLVLAVSGGRSWRAHRECTPINVELMFLPEKAEDVRELGAMGLL